MNNLTKGTPRLTPLDNWAFQKIFGKSESRRATRTLVNLVFERVGIDPIGEIDSIASDTSLPNAVSLKAPRLDVVLMSGGLAVDLEAERRRVDVENKALYYSSCLLAARVEKGADRDYEDLPQTVVIVFMQGHVKFADEGQFVTAARLHWETREGMLPGNDRLVFVLVELDKVAKRYNADSDEVATDELTAWLYVLANGYRDSEEVDQVMGKVLSVKEFGERYDLAMGDPEAWEAYDRHVKWEMELNSIEKNAKRSGFEDGFEDGFTAGQAHLIDKLRSLGVDSAILDQAKSPQP